MTDNPYLSGPYAPIAQERSVELDVIAGQLPDDLQGMVVRNGPNPRFAPRGRHHWFDGDGMLHAVRFEGGRAHYHNRWIRTAGFAAEEEAGHALWSGLLEPTGDNPRGTPYKDTANTDVIAHNGWLLATWYVCGAAYRIDPVELRTDGPARFGRDEPLRLSAHAKVDRQKGELLWFDYGPRPPFMRYGVVSPQGKLIHQTDIDLPGPRLPHDMAFTERYAILMDLPVYPRPEALRQKRWLVAYHREQPARFGILPRRAEGAQIRWFEAEPCYVYHVVNAWEQDDEVIVIGCRCDDPLPKPDPNDGELARALANLRLNARLYRWRFNMRTGTVREEPLDDRNSEFPTIDERMTGVPNRYGYHMRIPQARTLLFDGIVKYDLHNGSAEELSFGPGVYGSEAPFAPRTSSRAEHDRSEDDRAEDDGYLLSFVDDRAADRSELWVVDAAQLSAGPVARLRIPERVPLGFHACWVSPDELAVAAQRGAA